MSSKDAHLYQQRKHNLTGGRELNTSGTFSFTSDLSTLINNPSKEHSKPTSARLKPKKDDIFHVHNRNTAKRAKRDHEPDSAVSLEQKHTTDGESLDKEIWKRSQAKMKEKARIYAAMKRGDLEDADEKYAVDFDSKWAEKYDSHDKKEPDSASSSDENDGDEEEESQEDANKSVEYTDEFGRTRTGTRREVDRITRQNLRQQRARSKLQSDEFSARPDAPTNIIRGDTIQSGAFAPDALVADQMEELARKRDRSATPPEAERFDSRREIRNLGTGFFAFSKEDGERERQMKGLEEERRETERVRSEKGKKRADDFLSSLGQELAGKPSREDENTGR